uniref:Uncharacterized protein n=1 Tax=Anguilla anguilla TaxID=7936 RepID=A0A0E9U2S3_ANGAN
MLDFTNGQYIHIHTVKNRTRPVRKVYTTTKFLIGRRATL